MLVRSDELPTSRRSNHRPSPGGWNRVLCRGQMEKAVMTETNYLRGEHDHCNRSIRIHLFSLTQNKDRAYGKDAGCIKVCLYGLLKDTDSDCSPTPFMINSNTDQRATRGLLFNSARSSASTSL